MTILKKRPAWAAVLLAGGSFLAGGLNGLLGTGGGMILVFLLSSLLDKEQGKEAFVLSSFGVLVFSLVSAFGYGTGGSLSSEALPRFALPAAFGGAVGALLMDKCKLGFLKKLFAVLLLYSGCKMVGLF